MQATTNGYESPPTVSVILWGYGQSMQCIQACLEVLLSTSLPVEILLGNNADTSSAPDIRLNRTSGHCIVYTKETFPNRAAFWNRGIETARGEYLVFMDGGDRIEAGALDRLLLLARQTGVDMVRGGLVCVRNNEPPVDVYAGLTDTDGGQLATGADSLISLFQRTVYFPTAYGYIYKREWVLSNLRFDESLVCPEEIWLIEAHLRAGNVRADRGRFYECRTPKEYRIEDIDTDGPKYASHLFEIGNRLHSCIDDVPSEPLRSWLLVNVCRIFAGAGLTVAGIRTRSFGLPAYRLPSDCEIDRLEVPGAQEKCRRYCRQANQWLREFTAWHDNPCDRIMETMAKEELQGKRIILVYNSPAWQDYDETLRNLPKGYALTLDRTYADRAFAIVFHIPTLYEHLYGELEKPDGQIWAAWNMEPESKVPLLDDEAFLGFFDLRMDYHPYADIVCPYYAGFKPERIEVPTDPTRKKNRVCMLVSSGVNQSGREEYLAELMKYTPVDSYGRLYHNKDMDGEDRGWESKIELYSQYKFVIAFENSILEDYVTEKLYDPLISGSVPVYLGAPNVVEYLPGDDCVLRADRFGSPQELAKYIERCYADDEEYLKYHRWRNLPWREDFVRKVAVQEDSPFVRLCGLLDRKYPLKP